VQRLDAMGYARVPTVTEVAQFSVRGGILDVYGFGMAAPVRLEWSGDDIESLRTFDLDSQRSGDAIGRVTILPVRTEWRGAWRAQLARFPRLALDPADADVRFPIAPPEPVDRDIKRLRRIVATEPPTVILCDNEGQLERLEELLAGDRATLAVGALDGGFVLPALRVLTDHEIFRRARRLRRPRRYREATATAATRALKAG